MILEYTRERSNSAGEIYWNTQGVPIWATEVNGTLIQFQPPFQGAASAAKWGPSDLGKTMQTNGICLITTPNIPVDIWYVRPK